MRLRDKASLDQPDRITPVERTIDYHPDLAIDLAPNSVVVVEIASR